MTATDPHDLTVDQTLSGTHAGSVDGHSLPAGPTSCDALAGRARGHPLTVDHTTSGPQGTSVDGHPFLGQPTSDAHAFDAEDSPPAGQLVPEAQMMRAGRRLRLVEGAAGRNGDVGQGVPDTQTVRADDLLLILGDTLDDLENARKAVFSRHDALTRPLDRHGKGLDPGSDIAQTLLRLAEGFHAVEAPAVAALERALRAHPIAQWVADQKGVGAKSAARLLAAIGDPYWHAIADRPRTVSELWAYCGLHVLHPGHEISDARGPSAGVDPSSDADQARPADAHATVAGVAPSLTSGRKANWNVKARARVWVIADACIKQGSPTCPKLDGQPWRVHVPDCRCSPYRVLYDEARQRYDGGVHAARCKRCKDDGYVGGPLRAGHVDARARRYVAKRFLRDLWREAKRLHESGAW